MKNENCYNAGMAGKTASGSGAPKTSMPKIGTKMYNNVITNVNADQKKQLSSSPANKMKPIM